MPKIDVVLYKNDDGSVPVLDWLEELPKKAKAKCRVKLARLRDEGQNLRRPEADYLRDGIYELRVRLQGINYRMLYFFRGSLAAVVSHGLVKEREVPAKQIEMAIARRKKLLADPNRHIYKEDDP